LPGIVKNDINININRSILIFITLCSLQFFKIAGLGNLTKIFQLLAGGTIVGLLLFFIVYGEKKEYTKLNFKPYIIILLISVIPSMITSAYFHDQSLGRTLYEQRDIYFYLLYFLLHYMSLNTKFLERLIFSLGILYGVFYIMQYFLYPTMIFDVQVLVDRNTIRMNLPGVSFGILNYFYSLNKYFIERRFKYIVAMSLMLIVSILLGGRQVVFMLTFVTILFLVINRHVKYKPAILLLSFVGLFAIYVAFEDIFKGLFIATQQTTKMGSEDIRIRAVRYFLFEFFPNKWTYIFGNGNPSSTSPYGRSIDRLMNEQSFFIDDVGMVGVYVYYGAIFVLFSFIILIKSLFLKISDRGKYIKYYLIMVLQATMTGTGFMNSSFIVVYCIMLYILDLSYMERNYEQSKRSIQPEFI
jgi:hypothetical protein